MKLLFGALRLFLALAILVSVVFLSGFLFGWQNIWPRIFGDPDLGPVAFESLAKGPRPNQALICPQGLCNDADLDRQSPVYKIDASRLHAELLSSLKNEERLVRVDGQDDPLNLRFVQTSKIMRFPDTIRVRLIPLDNNRSTLALYTQAQIGYKDFGANLERANRWLKRLEPFEE